MNSLELLMSERSDIQAAHTCVTEGLNRLNMIRDKLFYSTLEKEVEKLSKHLEYLDSEIEKAKLSISGLVVSSNQEGHILSAKTKEGSDVFLRIRFFKDGVRGDNWNDAMMLDWVTTFDNLCFIQFENFISGNQVFSKDKFKDVYKHYKKELEEKVDPSTIKLKSVEKEITQNYRFHEDQ